MARGRECDHYTFDEHCGGKDPMSTVHFGDKLDGRNPKLSYRTIRLLTTKNATCSA
jgi:hypothetical protein